MSVIPQNLQTIRGKVVDLKNFLNLVKMPENLNDKLGRIYVFHVTQKGSYLRRDKHPSRKLGIGHGQFIKK